MSFLEAASREVDRIISRKSYRNKKYRRAYRKYAASLQIKTEEDELAEDYAEETKRALRSRQRVRSLIYDKVAECYPHRVREGGLPQRCLLTDIVVPDQTKVERAYREDDGARCPTKSLTKEERTTFYSLSKRKCVVIEDEFRANRDFKRRLKQEKLTSYVDYLAANRPDKCLIVSEYKKKQWCLRPTRGRDG